MGTRRAFAFAVVLCSVFAVPASAQTTGMISGRVVDTAGSPVGGVVVYAWNERLSGSFTGTDGTFAIAGLPAGTYFLEAFDPAERYVRTFYGTSCPAYRCVVYEGAPVTVTVGAVTDVTFPVTLGGTVQARLFDGATMAPFSFGSVHLFDSDGYYVSYPRAYPDGVPTFTMVPAGKYYLVWQGSGFEGYANEISDGRHCRGNCSVTGGTPFEVQSGETVVREMVLDRGGRITGRLSDASTGQVPWSVDFIAESADGSIFRWGSRVFDSPDPNLYEFRDLPPGRYFVRAEPWGGNFEGYIAEAYGGAHIPCVGTSPECIARRRLGTPVDVAIGATTPNVDIAVDRGGSIAGGLTMAGPVTASVTVSVLNDAGVAIVQSGFSHTAPGTYVVRGLPSGRYFVCVSGADIVTQAYGGVQFPGTTTCARSAGTHVDVVAGSATTGIDFTLTPVRIDGAGTIEGTVRSTSGTLAFVTVGLYRNGSLVTFAGTDAAGHYKFTFARPGTYHIRTEVSGNFVDEWYGGVCVVCNNGFGNSVTLAPGGVVAGVDFELSPGGTIAGTVNVPATVTVYDGAGRVVKQTGGGSFSISGLAAGTYYLAADPGPSSDMVPQVYPDIPCMSTCRPQDGAPLTIAHAGAVVSVTIVMRRGGTIRGRAVTDGVQLSNHLGDLPQFTLQAYDAAGRPAGRFAGSAKGLYEIRGLPPGSYFVRTVDAQRSGFAEQTYRATTCAGCPVTSGTPIEVVAGRVTGSVDFILQRAGTISGVVRDAATSAALENVTVQALSRSGAIVGTAVSNMDGTYVIRGLPPASYDVAVPNGGVYLPRRYTSPTCVYCDPSIGDRVAVSATTNATGIDIYLQRGGRIVGRASRADGAALTDIPVTIVNAAGASMAHVLTDANGAYIATVPAGTYFARAQGSGGFRTQMFSGVTCPRGICNTATATALSVTTGAIRAGVNFPLQQCAPPVIGPSTLPSAMVGSNYSSTIQASHGVAPYGFALASGALPPGLSLDAGTGVLRGVVAIAGDYQFTVGVTDNAGCGATRQYSVSIGECRVTPSTTSVAFTAQGGSADVAIESTCEWPVGVDGAWISVTNVVRGVGGNVRISAPFNSGAARAGFVAVGSTRIAVRQAALTSTAPFGQFDLPRDGVQVSGSIALGGWALDDVQVARITIYRDSVPPEAPGRLVFIGNGVSVRGARPDVEAAYPTMPGRERAGWGYLLLTNMLPNGGNGTFRLHAFAVDVEGNQVLLGSRTIVGSNVAAIAPFGAIDTPTQGGTVSGTNYVNFGWALTPMPKSIPEDGSTIMVYIDGVPIGNVSYGHFRGDIATLFPNLANSNGAVGFRTIDTTQLADGVHTIAWVVIDSDGVAKGIGSRFFTVANEGISALNAASKIVADAAQRVSTPEVASPQPATRSLAIAEMGHVAVDLAREFADVAPCAGSYDGYEEVGAERRPLPVGSSLDAVTGQFAWHPGPGFIGSYRLVFERRDCVGNVAVMPVAITISPKH